jgi:lysozyme family protein
MADNFSAATAVVLGLEGVYSDDPQDSGAETKWGIARAKHPEIPADTWSNFTLADALAVYRLRYWSPHRLDEAPWPWALAIFDGEVSQGSVIGLAQNALGIPVDGIVGPQTLRAMNVASSELLDIFFAGRAIAYVQLKQFPVYGRGWLKRLFAVRAAASADPGVS